MRKTRLGALGLLLLFVAPLLFSGDSVSNGAAYAVDVDSGTVTFFRHVGLGNSPTGGAIPGPGTIETVGSSTTVTESVASSLPFTDISVGDVIQVVPPPSQSAPVVLRVEAKASGASITVYPAVNLGTAGVTWSYYKLQSGTGINDGWFDVSGGSATMGVFYLTGDIDALLVRWECRSAAIGALPVLVFPGVSSECGITGDATTVPGLCYLANGGIEETVTVQVSGFSQCRVGLAFNTTDTADAAGTTEEDVRVTVQVNRPTP